MGCEKGGFLVRGCRVSGLRRLFEGRNPLVQVRPRDRIGLWRSGLGDSIYGECRRLLLLLRREKDNGSMFLLLCLFRYCGLREGWGLLLWRRDERCVDVTLALSEREKGLLQWHKFRTLVGERPGTWNRMLMVLTVRGEGEKFVRRRLLTL